MECLDREARVGEEATERCDVKETSNGQGSLSQPAR
jgi:hypothetical protein